MAGIGISADFFDVTLNWNGNSYTAAIDTPFQEKMRSGLGNDHYDPRELLDHLLNNCPRAVAELDRLAPGWERALRASYKPLDERDARRNEQVRKQHEEQARQDAMHPFERMVEGIAGRGATSGTAGLLGSWLKAKKLEAQTNVNEITVRQVERQASHYERLKAATSKAIASDSLVEEAKHQVEVGRFRRMQELKQASAPPPPPPARAIPAPPPRPALPAYQVTAQASPALLDEIAMQLVLSAEDDGYAADSRSFAAYWANVSSDFAQDFPQVDPVALYRRAEQLRQEAYPGT